jgi:heterogeneous nuclear rnp K-like protein
MVEVYGSAKAISHAINKIGRQLLEDWERGLGTALFHPTASDERMG